MSFPDITHRAPSPPRVPPRRPPYDPLQKGGSSEGSPERTPSERQAELATALRADAVRRLVERAGVAPFPQPPEPMRRDAAAAAARPAEWAWEEMPSNHKRVGTPSTLKPPCSFFSLKDPVNALLRILESPRNGVYQRGHGKLPLSLKCVWDLQQLLHPL